MKIHKLNKIISFLFLSFLSINTFGQTASTDPVMTGELAVMIVVGLVFVVAILVLGIAFRVYQMLSVVVRDQAIKKAEKEGKEYVEEESIWQKFIKQWTKAVPVEQEDSIDTGHEYDGIRELDNHLPPWWLALFYGSIIFGIIYMFGYHVADWWPLQEQEYEISVVKAAEIAAKENVSGENFDESNIEYNSDPIFLSEGKTVFEATCASCHRQDGGGGAGPNLTDQYWLHGGDIKSIYLTIKNGVPAKGMASWEKALSPKKMAQVTSYIISLEGTNPPDAKAPQGELIEQGKVIDNVEIDSVKVEGNDQGEGSK